MFQMFGSDLLTNCSIAQKRSFALRMGDGRIDGQMDGRMVAVYEFDLVRTSSNASVNRVLSAHLHHKQGGKRRVML